MKTIMTASALAISLLAGPSLAQECVPFDSGEILCDDGSYMYHWSPASGQWQVLDRAATASALGIDLTDGAPSSPSAANDADVIYGGDSSLTTTDDGCTMFSSPGYGFGESLSFSSGC